jgi:hypothetical protein
VGILCSSKQWGIVDVRRRHQTHTKGIKNYNKKRKNSIPPKACPAALRMGLRGQGKAERGRSMQPACRLNDSPCCFSRTKPAQICAGEAPMALSPSRKQPLPQSRRRVFLGSELRFLVVPVGQEHLSSRHSGFRFRTNRPGCRVGCVLRPL